MSKLTQGTLIVNVTITKKEQLNYNNEKSSLLMSEDKEVIISYAAVDGQGHGVHADLHCGL